MKYLKSRNELIEMMEQFAGLIVSGTEEEQDAMVVKLKASILDPEWMDYIFNSEEFYDESEGLLVEPLVDKILTYKPILL